MKETDFNEKDKIENVKQVEVQSKLELHNRYIPHKGHTLFEVNTKTGEIVKAEYEDVREVPFDKGKKFAPITTKKVIMKENCRYISALNIKSLFKKLGYVVKK